MVLVVDFLNKWSQGQEGLQDRVHVASLPQVGKPERKDEERRIQTQACLS